MTPVERHDVGGSEALVAAVLARNPVIDGHNDLLWHARKHHGYDWDQLDVGADLSGTGVHTDLQRLRAGGVGAQFWSVYVPGSLSAEEILTATFEQIDAAHDLIRRYGDRLALATGAADVEAAWATGRIASLLGAEGGHQIGGSLAVLRSLQALGVRYLTLTHNDNVAWADSATDRPALGGLSAFGREVVTEMNRVGVLVDLSHVSADVMRQALEISTAPVIFSHSSARAVCPHPRNVPDDVLSGLTVNGGVCMVTFVPWFVTPAVHEWDLAAQDAAWEVGIDSRDLAAYQPFAETYAKKVPPPRSTVADVVAHLEHVREVAGIEHVGLGGDYDGVEWLPEGLDDVSGYPRLLVALAERGWSKADLAALTCRNTLRVLSDAGCRSSGHGTS
ncbi:MAG: rane dipeptidase [Marmoricola sp.]|nr:rane dipeptidase [Marmoricola sp.]